ncbi:MAG: nucleotidyltransferase family protein [Acidobacteria bacterium]|nr:nucleotidyltransferase family protein [Acidobacteriota bacterium]
MTAFVDLLIQSQRVRLGSAGPESIEIPAEWDWMGFQDAATYHGLILGSFGALCQPSVASQMPPGVAAGFQQEYRRLSAFSLAQAAELGRITSCLDEAGIRALSFKGPALTQQLFANLVSRESADLDLLVPRDVVFAALDLLGEEGYTWAEIGPRPHTSSDLSSNHAFTLKSTDDRFLIDLHWHLAEDVALEFVPELASVFEDSEMVVILGRPVAAVRREKLLPLLSFHSVKHAWYLLKWFVDIAALARLPAFDWDAALRYIDSTRSSGVARVSHLGLLVADSLFDCALPPEVRRRLEKDRCATALVPAVIDDIRASRMYDMPEQHRVLLGLKESAWSRLRTAGAAVMQKGWDRLAPSR